jgi:hypothetical protein
MKQTQTNATTANAIRGVGSKMSSDIPYERQNRATDAMFPMNQFAPDFPRCRYRYTKRYAAPALAAKEATTTPSPNKVGVVIERS